MKSNKLLSAINGIVFGIIFVLIFTESVFNFLGLWTAWNLFGYPTGFLLLPIFNVTALISAVASVISFYSDKKTNENTVSKKICFLPILFFILGLFLTIIAYKFVFTWGF